MSTFTLAKFKHIGANSKYFPNLDSLRFLVSMAVLLLHIEDIKKRYGYQATWCISYFTPDVSLTVSLFFVLSGFLITYLLLKEQEKTSTIDVKKFYLKRTLKIWPLYFFIGIIGFFLLPLLDNNFNGKFAWHVHGNLGIYFLLYCLFLPLTIKSDTIGAAWTARVEAVFYIIWPIFLSRFKNHLKVFVWIVILLGIFHNISFYLATATHNHLLIAVAQLANAYRISCMAIGGIAAWLLVNNKKEILSFIYRRDVQWAVYGMLVVLLMCRVHMPVIYFEFYSFIFAFIILNLASNPNSIIRLEYKWMSYLGVISYGIYLYNPITRLFCLELVEHVFKGNVAGWQMNLLLYSSTIVSTIIISVLSFELFEKRFLNLKKRLA